MSVKALTAVILLIKIASLNIYRNRNIVWSLGKKAFKLIWAKLMEFVRSMGGKKHLLCNLICSGFFLCFLMNWIWNSCNLRTKNLRFHLKLHHETYWLSSLYVAIEILIKFTFIPLWTFDLQFWWLFISIWCAKLSFICRPKIRSLSDFPQTTNIKQTML